MLDFSQMLVHLLAALGLGALMGFEREIIGKEAGVRTSMLVAGGSAIFAMIGLTLPYIVATSPENLPEVIARNSGFLAVIANIVVGVGFLGAGVIIKTGEHVKGLTTAAALWSVAAVGTLAGIGLIKFAIAAAFLMSGALFILTRAKILKPRPEK